MYLYRNFKQNLKIDSVDLLINIFDDVTNILQLKFKMCPKVHRDVNYYLYRTYKQKQFYYLKKLTVKLKTILF